jgi:hypothetical protein
MSHEALLLFPPGIAPHPRLPSTENELRRLWYSEGTRVYSVSPGAILEGRNILTACAPRRADMPAFTEFHHSHDMGVVDIIKSLQPTDDVTRPNATITPTVSMESQLLVKILDATIGEYPWGIVRLIRVSMTLQIVSIVPSPAQKSNGSESEYKESSSSNGNHCPRKVRMRCPT